jgi:hypothetical protein
VHDRHYNRCIVQIRRTVLAHEVYDFFSITGFAVAGDVKSAILSHWANNVDVTAYLALITNIQFGQSFEIPYNVWLRNEVDVAGGVPGAADTTVWTHRSAAGGAYLVLPSDFNMPEFGGVSLVDNPTRAKLFVASPRQYQNGNEYCRIIGMTREDLITGPAGNLPIVGYQLLDTNGNAIDYTEEHPDILEPGAKLHICTVNTVVTDDYIPLRAANLGPIFNQERNLHIAAQNVLATRKVGSLVETQEPMLCGPLNPFAAMTPRAPIAQSSPFLPPRLGTFRLTYPTPDTVSGSFDIQVTSKTLVMEQVGIPDAFDELEQNLIHYPSITTFQVQCALGQERRITLRDGTPDYLYITQSPFGVQRIRVVCRNRPIAVCEKFTLPDYFKVIARTAHPQAAVQYKEWVDESRGFLIRAEEFGDYNPNRDERLHLTISVEATDSRVDTYTLTVQAIYLGQAMQDLETDCKFLRD